MHCARNSRVEYYVMLHIENTFFVSIHTAPSFPFYPSICFCIITNVQHSLQNLILCVVYFNKKNNLFQTKEKKR